MIKWQVIEHDGHLDVGQEPGAVICMAAHNKNNLARIFAQMLNEVADQAGREGRSK